MYKTNVLNFIINTTGVVYDGNSEDDKNKFIRENLPDAMDMFINIMGGVIPDYKPYYGEIPKNDEPEPVTITQEIALDLMAKYKQEPRPNFKYSYEAKEYLDEGRKIFAEELREKQRKYEIWLANNRLSMTYDGITPHGDFLPERKATSLDLDYAMESDNRMQSIGECLDNLIHFGVLSNN